MVGYVANLVWRLLLARRLFTPVVFGDESRYLIFARVLADGPGGYGGDTEATRRAGYALLISPAYWLTSDPFLVHRLVQGFNAVVNATTLPLAYLFARRVLGTDRRWGLGLAVVAAGLPAVVFFSAFALPNAVLTPLLLAWLLALHHWFSTDTGRGRLFAAIGSGAMVGLMYVIHVRALLLLGAHVLVVAGLFAAGRAPAVQRWLGAVVWLSRSEVAGSALGFGVLMLIHPLLKHLLHGKVITGGIEPEDRMLSAFTTVDGLLRTISDGTGQLWYVCASTWGLGALGLVVMGYRLIRTRQLPLPANATLLAALISTVLIAVITTAALPDDGKENYRAYPGYIIFLAPIWVMVGLATLHRARSRLVAAVGGTAIAVMVVSWFIVEDYSRPRGGIGQPGIFSPIDAPEPLFLAGDWQVVHLARVTATVLLFITLTAAALVLRRQPWIAGLPPWTAGLRRWIAGLLLLAVTALNVAAMNAATGEMVAIAHDQDGPHLVRDAHVRPGEVVACDPRLVVLFNHQREVYWRALVTLDLSQQQPPPNVDIVVGPWYTGDPSVDWDGTEHGWQLVLGNPRKTWALWRRNST